jgi:hypothetical protein
VFVPLPVAVVPLVTDTGGSLAVAAPLPPAFPGGFDIIVQCWILDAAAPNGVVSASAATRAHAP